MTARGASAVLGSVTEGLVSVFSLQLMSRVLTFALNVAVVRAVDRAAYGIGSVQMQLVCDAVLALSREGFRDACQRTPADAWLDSRSRSRMLAVAWLCVPFAAVVCAVVLGVSSSMGTGQAEPGFSAVSISAMFVAAAGLEMLSEPLYILAHNLLLIHIRVRVEMIALVTKIFTTSALVALYPATPLLAFALGQIAYGAAMLVAFVAYFVFAEGGLGMRETCALLSGWQSLSAMRQTVGGSDDAFDGELLRMVRDMSVKAFFKFFLEKGETLILLQQFPAETWGMYGIIQNLGSLVVRLIFLPVEDMAQLAFSKLLSSGANASAAELLGVSVKLVSLVGAFAAAFGPGYSFTVVHILYGSKWSSTEMPALLSWYSTYILFLALNGVTEAFVHASASGSQMRQRSGLLLVATAAYLAAACLLAPVLGARALIAGNCVNMALRTILSLRHASDLFASRGLPGAMRIKEMLPGVALTSCLAFFGSVAALADKSFVAGKGSEVPRGILGLHVIGAVVAVASSVLVQCRFDRAFQARVRLLLGKDKSQ